MKRNGTRGIGDGDGRNMVVRTWKMKRKEANEIKIEKID
jgi:hypothetical protein